MDPFLSGIFFLLALSLACSLFSLEISGFWTVNHPVAHYRTYETGSLVALWSLIPIILAFVFVRRGAKAWMPLPWICSAIGAVILLASLEHYSYPSRLFALNPSFLPKLIFLLSLWGVQASTASSISSSSTLQTRIPWPVTQSWPWSLHSNSHAGAITAPSSPPK